MCGALYDPSASPPGKTLGVPLNRRLEKPHCRSGCFGEATNHTVLAGNQTTIPHTFSSYLTHYVAPT